MSTSTPIVHNLTDIALLERQIQQLQDETDLENSILASDFFNSIEENAKSHAILTNQELFEGFIIIDLSENDDLDALESFSRPFLFLLTKVAHLRQVLS